MNKLSDPQIRALRAINTYGSKARAGFARSTISSLVERGLLSWDKQGLFITPTGAKALEESDQ